MCIEVDVYLSCRYAFTSKAVLMTISCYRGVSISLECFSTSLMETLATTWMLTVFPRPASDHLVHCTGIALYIYSAKGNYL